MIDNTFLLAAEQVAVTGKHRAGAPRREARPGRKKRRAETVPSVRGSVRLLWQAIISRKVSVWRRKTLAFSRPLTGSIPQLILRGRKCPRERYLRISRRGVRARARLAESSCFSIIAFLIPRYSNADNHCGFVINSASPPETALKL